MLVYRCLLISVLWFCLAISQFALSQDPAVQNPVVQADGKSTPSVPYEQLVHQDNPVAYWQFDGATSEALNSRFGNDPLSAQIVGKVEFQQQGPRPPEFPLFPTSNASAYFSGKNNFLRVADAGDDRSLDMKADDEMTIEAWVFPRSINNDQFVAIIGKGRTGNAGFEVENLNYCLRLKGSNGTALLNFLYRSQNAGSDTSPVFHRWTSTQGFPADSGWHHVALTHRFGDPSSVRGYINGHLVEGKWDLGGTPSAMPWVDNDKVRIGTSSEDHAGAFTGWIDEVAIYRHVLSPEKIATHFSHNPDALQWPSPSQLPDDRIRVELYAGVPDRTWSFSLPTAISSFDLSSLAFTSIPNHYNVRGVRDDYKLPVLAQSYVKCDLPSGKYRVLLRSKHATRLWLNKKEIAANPFLSRNGDGHELVPELVSPLEPSLYPLPPGHREQLATVELDAGVHIFRLDAIIGGKNLRPECGEVCVAIADENGHFRVLAAQQEQSWPLTSDHWQRFLDTEANRLLEVNKQQRFAADQNEKAYWDIRHQHARSVLDRQGRSNAVADSIDAIALRPGQLGPAIRSDDDAFLRRVTLDTTGVIPTAEEQKAFAEDGSPGKRQRAIDRLLNDPRWADSWVGYWQDVLAENPGIVKPEQNNTGPFRWWIYESFLDNKPMDRFATELVMMEGSRFFGGPAGFAMASQNDVPMAAKAHVLTKAFLGMEMACARCHDAPNHPFLQKELFSLAAMLKREAIELPKSSTVPINPGGRQPLVSISLKAGEKLSPEWHIESFASSEVDESILRNPEDTRERFAALLTSPANDRFAKVIVNRVWHRWMGWAFVEPVDDWRGSEQTNSPILEFLANELVRHDYDLKHVAGLILNSSLYEAVPVSEAYLNQARRDNLLPNGPLRRRMSAEQIIDSLFAVAGKSIDVEPMSLDPESRRPPEEFLHLGTVRRAWQFASTSTDRDRPALNMPGVQQVVDVMIAFGWRDARPSPITTRDESASPIQSLVLGNGLTATRLARLSDDSVFTKLAVQAVSSENFVRNLFLVILSREPDESEIAELSAVVATGFSTRILDKPVDNVDNASQPMSYKRNAVSWSNHLVPEATRIKLALEQEILWGDAPSRYLVPEWRERAEDVVWALINSPEFIFIP